MSRLRLQLLRLRMIPMGDVAAAVATRRLILSVEPFSKTSLTSFNTCLQLCAVRIVTSLKESNGGRRSSGRPSPSFVYRSPLLPASAIRPQCHRLCSIDEQFSSTESSRVEARSRRKHSRTFRPDWLYSGAAQGVRSEKRPPERSIVRDLLGYSFLGGSRQTLPSRDTRQERPSLPAIKIVLLRGTMVSCALAAGAQPAREHLSQPIRA